LKAKLASIKIMFFASESLKLLIQRSKYQSTEVKLKFPHIDPMKTPQLVVMNEEKEASIHENLSLISFNE